MATAIGSTTLTNLFASVVEKPTPSTQPATRPITQPMTALTLAATATPIVDVLPTIIDRQSNWSSDLIASGMANAYLNAGDSRPLNHQAFRTAGGTVAILATGGGTSGSKNAPINDAFRQAVHELDLARPLPMTFAGSPDIADAGLSAFHDQVAASYAYVPGRTMSDSVAPLGMDDDTTDADARGEKPTRPVSHSPRVRITRQSGGLAYETGVASRPLGDNGVRPHPGVIDGIDPWDGGGRNSQHGLIPGAGEVGDIGSVSRGAIDPGAVDPGAVDQGAGSVVVTPEPATLVLALAATVGVMTRRRTK